MFRPSDAVLRAQGVCIGNHFARLEAALVLATWLRKARDAPDPGTPLRVFPAVTLRPRDPVRLYVAGRQS